MVRLVRTTWKKDQQFEEYKARMASAINSWYWKCMERILKVKIWRSFFQTHANCAEPHMHCVCGDPKVIAMPCDEQWNRTNQNVIQNTEVRFPFLHCGQYTSRHFRSDFVCCTLLRPEPTEWNSLHSYLPIKITISWGSRLRILYL